jgi:3-deoxy-manno-octulosonate cytidylyltransferase (CMP-KDO synthetase)
MKLAIAIPARYGSTRLPGKPLARIQGKTMLQRVVELARKATEGYDNVDVFVATDDSRIQNHADEIGVACLITPVSCPTGSDRVLSAIKQLDEWPDFTLNLQGDAPFTPPSVIRKILQYFKDNPDTEVVTPVHQLSWSDLDRLREAKEVTPFSGTTATLDSNKRALWFSKNIIPAIRKEDNMRQQSAISPIYQHVGLYGFRSDVLRTFCQLPQGVYEDLEGLEQLRMLENGIRIDTVEMDIENGMIQSGIDSPEDIERAEAYIRNFGEPI